MKAKFERVNLLYTAIAHQRRRALRSESHPAGENVAGLRKIFQAYDVLQYAIFYSDANQFRGAAPGALAHPHIDIFSVRRPLVVVERPPSTKTDQ